MMKIYKKFLIQTYNIGLIKKKIGDIIDTGVNAGDIIWLRHNYKDRFFADPFMIKEDEAYYYFLVEEFLFWEEKGKITLLKVKKSDFSLIERKVVIEEEKHLSFPFCELNGNTVIPESVILGKTKKYTIDPDRMTVINEEIILNEGLIDAAFFTDEANNEWILTAKAEKPKEDLYIYKRENNGYVAVNHGKKVFSSIEEARSAGRLFKYNGKRYRPVQDSNGRYGKQTRLMCIDKLDSNEYKAHCVRVINGSLNPPYNETLHTFNVYNDCIVVDGSKDYFRFPMKIFYKKFKWMFKE